MEPKFLYPASKCCITDIILRSKIWVYSEGLLKIDPIWELMKAWKRETVIRN